MTDTTPSSNIAKTLPPEENLQDEANFKDLLVNEEDLEKHTVDAHGSITHGQVREALSKINGSFVSEIREERDQG